MVAIEAGFNPTKGKVALMDAWANLPAFPSFEVEFLNMDQFQEARKAKIQGLSERLDLLKEHLPGLHNAINAIVNFEEKGAGYYKEMIVSTNAEERKRLAKQKYDAESVALVMTNAYMETELKMIFMAGIRFTRDLRSLTQTA